MLMGLGVGCVNNVHKRQPILKFTFEFYTIWQFEVTYLNRLMVVTGRIISLAQYFFIQLVKLLWQSNLLRIIQGLLECTKF